MELPSARLSGTGWPTTLVRRSRGGLVERGGERGDGRENEQDGRKHEGKGRASQDTLHTVVLSWGVTQSSGKVNTDWGKKMGKQGFRLLILALYTRRPQRRAGKPRPPPPSATLNLAAASVYIAHAGGGRDEERVSSFLLFAALLGPLGGREEREGCSGWWLRSLLSLQ